MNTHKRFAVTWRRFYGWSTRRLYYEFAWAYDIAARLVSFGHWDGWRKDALAHVHGSHILEIGFGTGELLIEMAQRGWHVYGLDLSPAMHRVTARKMHKRNVWTPRVRGCTQSMPFADASFDTVIATFPAEYIIAQETLQNVERVMTKDGRFVITGLVGQIEHPLLRLLFKPIYGDIRDGALEYFKQVLDIAGFNTRIESKQGKWMSMPVMVLEKKQDVRGKEKGK